MEYGGGGQVPPAAPVLHFCSFALPECQSQPLGRGKPHTERNGITASAPPAWETSLAPDCYVRMNCSLTPVPTTEHRFIPAAGPGLLRRNLLSPRLGPLGLQEKAVVAEEHAPRRAGP